MEIEPVVSSSEEQLPQDVVQEETTAPPEPRIIYVFDLKSWYGVLSPLTKLDLIDITPMVSTQFYFDGSIPAYILILTKNKWDALEVELKKRYMLISRRVKEEIEGPMSTIDREKYENSDIFEIVMAQKQAMENSQIETPLETISEDVEPTPEDLLDSFNAVPESDS
jgi:hypothetical protein